MPMEIRSPADGQAGRASRWQMALGHHIPFALWTAYALVRPFTAGNGGLWCPTHALLGWCPTCGMTSEYTDLLYHGRIPGWWTITILGAFIAIAGTSLCRHLKT
jgi:hypothetical protein